MKAAYLRQSKRLLLTVFALLVNVHLFSQPPGGPPPGGGGTTGTTPPCWEPECIPIDGGLIFLLIGGVLFGAHLIYQYKRRQKSV